LGHVDDGNNGSSVRTDYHHMLVEKQPGVADDLPEQFGEYHVEYLDTPEETARCKVLRKDFSILKIQPMKNEGTKLRIVVSVYWVSNKRGNLNFGLSDWSTVEFRYNCEQQRLRSVHRQARWHLTRLLRLRAAEGLNHTVEEIRVAEVGLLTGETAGDRQQARGQGLVPSHRQAGYVADDAR